MQKSFSRSADKIHARCWSHLGRNLRSAAAAPAKIVSLHFLKSSDSAEVVEFHKPGKM
jgi:hypothetical protein